MAVSVRWSVAYCIHYDILYVVAVVLRSETDTKAAQFYFDTP